MTQELSPARFHISEQTLALIDKLEILYNSAEDTKAFKEGYKKLVHSDDMSAEIMLILTSMLMRTKNNKRNEPVKPATQEKDLLKMTRATDPKSINNADATNHRIKVKLK